MPSEIAAQKQCLVRTGPPRSETLPTTGATYGGLPSPRPGMLFGPDTRFELRELVGSGGTGRVFLVRDHRLDRLVAAKFLRGELAMDRAFAEGLLIEARNTARLQHANVVCALDLGTWEGQSYFVMELLDGPSLDQIVEAGPMEATRAVGIAVQVCRGIRHAHSLGVLHLDIKPSNVVLLDGDRVKIIDFGATGYVAALKREDAQSDPFVGTPAYMAPEQWCTHGVDERTDVWGIGLVLMQLLIGAAHPPSRRQTWTAGSAVVQTETRRLMSNVEPALVEIVHRSVDPRPEHRFQDVSALLSALERTESKACR